jgi:hypothetical protein
MARPCGSARARLWTTPRSATESDTLGQTFARRFLSPASFALPAKPGRPVLPAQRGRPVLPVWRGRAGGRGFGDGADRFLLPIGRCYRVLGGFERHRCPRWASTPELLATGQSSAGLCGQDGSAGLCGQSKGPVKGVRAGGVLVVIAASWALSSRSTARPMKQATWRQVLREQVPADEVELGFDLPQPLLDNERAVPRVEAVHREGCIARR